MTDRRSGSKKNGRQRSTSRRDTQNDEGERLARGRLEPSHRTPRHLIDGWPQVSERVRSAEHVALFLDFDGTLAPFRTRPEQVRLSDATRRALQRLIRHPQLRVFVLSGRRRADVQDRVGVPGVCCYGLHGWEGPTTGLPKSPAGRSLGEVRHQLRNRLAGLRGVWIEDKGPILGVHVRGAGASVRRRTSDVVEEVIVRFQPQLGALPGNRVWEVIPRELQGKGATVRALLGEMPPATLPIYLGDDATDETAFAVLRQGITVCVGGRRPTKARFDLRGPQEVRTFLKELESELAKSVENKGQASPKGAKAQKLRNLNK